ncbi:MAG: hypothetical protein H6679_02700 [Epsilonproteobacteria bacterium]|nr:hypothetical protein [Campylobacterota bacterium]
MKMMTAKQKFLFVIKKIAGIFLIIAGIFGLFLPFLQGIAMIASGIFLLDGRIFSALAKKIKGLKP